MPDLQVLQGGDERKRCDKVDEGEKMTAKEYLSKVQTYRRAIESTQLRIEELYAQASGVKAIVYDKDRVQVSPENRFEQFMVQIDAEAAKMARQIKKYQTEVQKRQDQINEIGKPEYAEVLRLRYLESEKDGTQMTLERISCIMHRSYNNVKHLHGWALQEFQKKYKLDTH